jgi:hypothetical protein
MIVISGFDKCLIKPENCFWKHHCFNLFHDEIRQLTNWQKVRSKVMEKKAIILETAEELRQARLRQPRISAEECEAQRLRHRLASEAFAEAVRNGTSKIGRTKGVAG